MADVTYIRVTPTGTKAVADSGDSGTWIPVSDLQLATQDGNGSLAFTLSNDDGIASALTQSIIDGTQFTIEVATYDDSTKSPTSAGTLLSYAKSTKALGTQQSTAATTNANTFSLNLGNISQTTYPPGGTPSQSAYVYPAGGAPGHATTPMPVPSNVQDGSSVAQSTSAAQDPASLTYYAQFISGGTYLKNVNGGTWFEVSGVSSNVANEAGNGQSSLSPLSLTVTDQAVVPSLFTDTAKGTSLTVQVEAVTSGNVVVDNTTYNAAQLSSFANDGEIGVAYSAYYAEHYAAPGAMPAVSTNESGTNPAHLTMAPPTNVSAGQPIDGYFLAVQGVTGDTAAPMDDRSKYVLSPSTGDGSVQTSGFVPSSSNFSIFYGGGKAGVSDVGVTSSSQALATAFDGDLLAKGHYSDISLAEYSGGATTGGANFSNAQVAGDGIDLVSGVHTYTFAYSKIGVANFNSTSGTTATSGGYDTTKTTTNAAVKAYAAPQAPSSSTSASQADSEQPASPTSAQPEAVRSDAAVAAAAQANTSYIQFRDANNNPVQSAAGETWFAVSSASFGASFNPIGQGISLSALDFTIGQNPIVATLDSDLVAGTKLTAEVATYGGSNNALQSDYILGQSAIRGHSIGSSPNAQEFAFEPTTFQETQYSSGAPTGTVTYDTTSGTAGTTQTSAPTAPTGGPPPSSALPQPLSTYVQFVGASGPLTNSAGSSWFKIPDASAGLSISTNAQNVTTATLGSLDLNVGDDQVTSQLDAAFLDKTTLNGVNVVTYNPDGSVVSSQSFNTAKVAADTVGNAGGDHAYSFTYTGYGETIAGSTIGGIPVNTNSATAGSTTTPPSLITTANVNATTAPGLSTLAFYGELKTEETGSEAFVGSASGFVALPQFAINFSNNTATFEVDPLQAASLARLADTNLMTRFEIAGYDSAGLSIDYVLSDASLTSNSVDPATGLDTATLSYNNLQETKTGSTPVTTGPNASQPVDAPADAPCYVTGTRIRTERGDVAVEDLRVGDIAVTASGANRPIRWIGSRLTHPRPHEAQPVRVAAHAFGSNRPARDLVVSPGHSLCVDVVGDVLIPAMALVNGTTITQEDVDAVTYWHVELDGHDILLAENMPAESYLEMGNRGFFSESEVVALDASPDAPVPTHADFCRPFHAEGALVAVVRAQLAARAVTLGWRLEGPGLVGDLHLMVDGVRIEPIVRGLAARFVVPANAQAVWLVSGTTVPADIAPGSSDRRALGLCVAALVIDDGFGAPVVVPMDDPRLCVGFHAVERDGDAAWRWTAGRARLPASLWEGLDDTFLRVDLAGPALPRWLAPARASEGSIPLSSLIA